MLRVGLVQAKPGMVLAMPVFNPKRPDTPLLKSGVVLDRHMIQRLREVQAREVWIEYPGLEFIANYVNPTIMSAQTEVIRQISSAFDLVLQSASAPLEYYAYRTAVSDLIDKLLDHPRACIFVQEMADADTPALRHASNVCMTSILIGLRLESYLVTQRTRLSPSGAREISGLGVGAMLHDVGMLQLDERVLRKWNDVHDESDPKWREHVTIGYEMLKGNIEPTASAAVLHHHQHFDGSGFPKRRRLDSKLLPVQGDEIHVFARIVAAADLFDRIRHPNHAPLSEEHEDRSIPVVRALNLIQRPPYSHWIDPMVLRGLMAVIPPYAPGSMVTLSNGESCVVTGFNPENPCRPTVAAIDVEDGEIDVECLQRVNLLHRPDLHVVECDGVNTSADNFYPTHAGQYDLDTAMKRLFNKVG
ncbi:MAG: HD domain-containing protein [Phycisphaerales bacterium]|nr:HD domain-containing protein [Phycisphaerales bacterium]